MPGAIVSRPLLKKIVVTALAALSITGTLVLVSGSRVQGDFVPSSDATYTVGTTSTRWKSGNFSSALRVSTVNTVRNEYVATMGTNSGDCTDIQAPCLTISYAILQACNAILSGNANINVADGTYNENIIACDNVSTSSTPSTAVTSFPYGNSRVNLIGNRTSPSSVIIQGSSGNLGVFAMENISTNYSLDGFTLQGVNASTESAIYASGDKANVFVNNINTTSTGRIMQLGFGATAYYDSGTAGGNHIISSRGFVVGRRSTLYLNKGVNVTSTVTSANAMMEVQDGGAIFTGTTNQTYNFTSLNCGSGAGFLQPSGAESIIRAFSTGDVVNARCITGGTSLWRPISGARAQIIGNATFNVSSTASYPLADIDAISYLYSLSTPTWNVIGSTARAIRLYQGGQALDPNNFGGATVTYAEFDSDYKYGYDARYSLQGAGSSTTMTIGGSALPSNTSLSVINAGGTTSTFQLGGSGKPGCLPFSDVTGAIKHVSITAAGAFQISSSACNP